MFNRAKKTLDEELKSYEKSRNSSLYNGGDLGNIESYDVEKDGVIYHCHQDSYRIVDDYDEALGSVEESHRESTGYIIVDGYKGETSKLDFTFIRPQDGVNVKCDESIKEIKVNAVNLRSIKLETVRPVFLSVVIDTGKVDTLLGVRKFIEKNATMIKDINIIEADKTLSSIVDDMLERRQEKEEKIARGKN